jgi:hypothetical protein
VNSYLYVRDVQKYKVIVRSGPGAACQRASGLIETTAETLPIVNISALGSTSICQGDSVQLAASPIPFDYTYQWRRFGVNIPNETGATLWARQSGNYRIQALKQGGCISTSNSITVNIVCRNGIVLDEGFKSVRVYPNPASQKIHFEWIGTASPETVTMLDLQGNIVLSFSYNSLVDNQIDVSDLPSGNYGMRIVFDDKTIAKRLITVLQ